MKIQEEFRNEILKRQEVIFSIEHSSTPVFSMLQEKLAMHFKVGEDVVVVKGVNGCFGSSSFDVRAFIYDSLEDKHRMEPRMRKKKKAEGTK